jgi:hypothetical protein
MGNSELLSASVSRRNQQVLMAVRWLVALARIRPRIIYYLGMVSFRTLYRQVVAYIGSELDHPSICPSLSTLLFNIVKST